MNTRQSNLESIERGMKTDAWEKYAGKCFHSKTSTVPCRGMCLAIDRGYQLEHTCSGCAGTMLWCSIAGKEEVFLINGSLVHGNFCHDCTATELALRAKEIAELSDEEDN